MNDQSDTQVVVRGYNGDTSKANDYTIDALKQLMTVASVILAFTVTFIKDLFGNSLVDTHLIALIIICWLLLLMSVPCAWIAILEAAKIIGKRTPMPYAFDRSSEDGDIKHCVRFAIWAQETFILGLIALAVFAALSTIYYKFSI